MKLIKELDNINEILELETGAYETVKIDKHDFKCQYIERFVFEGDIYNKFYIAKDDCDIWSGFHKYKFKKGNMFIITVDDSIIRIGQS